MCYRADEQELCRPRLDLTLLPSPFPASNISMLLGLGAELGPKLMEDFQDPCPLCHVVCVKVPGRFPVSCFPHPQPHTSLWLITVDMKG